MAYVKVHNPWKDRPDLSTPVTAAALDQIEDGLVTAAAIADAAQAAGKRTATVTVGAALSGYTTADVDFLAIDGSAQTALTAAAVAAAAKGNGATVVPLPGTYNCGGVIGWDNLGAQVSIIGEGVTITHAGDTTFFTYGGSGADAFCYLRGISFVGNGGETAIAARSTTSGGTTLYLDGCSFYYQSANAVIDANRGTVHIIEPDRRSGFAILGGQPAIDNCVGLSISGPGTASTVGSGFAQTYGIDGATIAARARAGDPLTVILSGTAIRADSTIFYSDTQVNLITRDSFVGGTSSVLTGGGGVVVIDILDSGLVVGTLGTPAIAPTWYGAIHDSVVDNYAGGLGVWGGVSGYAIDREGIVRNKFYRSYTGTDPDPLVTVGAAASVVSGNLFHDAQGSVTTNVSIRLTTAADGSYIQGNFFPGTDGVTDIDIQAGCTAAVLRGNIGTQAGALPKVVDNGTGTITP